MCRGHDPLFSGQSALPSLLIYHHCAALMPPHFQIFEKFSIFSLVLVQNFSSQDANFPNFRSLDPSFFKENPLPRPYFWKPVWHIPTKKKSWVPPRGDSLPPRRSQPSTPFILYLGYLPGICEHVNCILLYVHDSTQNWNASSHERLSVAQARAYHMEALNMCSFPCIVSKNEDTQIGILWLMTCISRPTQGNIGSLESLFYICLA